MKNVIKPEEMNVICNIQMMLEKINSEYSWLKDRDRLYAMNVDQLRTEQEALIPWYNKSLQK